MKNKLLILTVLIIGICCFSVLFQSTAKADDSINGIHPAKVTNITALIHSTSELSFGWDAQPDAASYNVYCLDETTGTYRLATTTTNNCVSFHYAPGTIHTYKVCAVKNVSGAEELGDLSDEFTGATNPEQVTSFSAIKSSQDSVVLSWSSDSAATGYCIYYYDYKTSKYQYYGDTISTVFTANNLNSGTEYRFKVCAYSYSKDYLGESSSPAECITYPAPPVVHCKAGDQKIRLTWESVTGATSYDIFMEDGNLGYKLLATNEGNDNCAYIADQLLTGDTYSFYVISHLKYNGKVYDSIPSDQQEITIEDIQDTSTDAKFYNSQSDFMASPAYTDFSFFRDNVDYSRSIVIPGLITTNVGGFVSKSMCPQGITFAGDYFLLSAYDKAGEENSVLYVINKNTKEFVKTLVLPYKYHVGGICFDGTNVWITTGTKVSSITYSDILQAIKTNKSYAEINPEIISRLGYMASYITYYNNKLWVGTYNKWRTSCMYSYTITNSTDGLALNKSDSMIMPTRVQGITFTDDGYLIMSRSSQLYKGIQGYMHRIDVYKPYSTGKANVNLALGKPVNYIYVPSMNEEITLCDSYLYINFESGAFSLASYKMDHVCALKLASIINKA